MCEVVRRWCVFQDDARPAGYEHTHTPDMPNSRVKTTGSSEAVANLLRQKVVGHCGLVLFDLCVCGMRMRKTTGVSEVSCSFLNFNQCDKFMHKHMHRRNKERYICLTGLSVSTELD